MDEGIRWEDTFQDLITQMGTSHSRERYWNELHDACVPASGKKTKVLFCTEEFSTEITWNVYSNFDKSHKT